MASPISEMRGRSMLLSLSGPALWCLALASSTSTASAQLDVASRARVADAFDGYALDRGAIPTLDAIELLGPTNAAPGTLAPETRLARARAALDLWLLSRIDPRGDEIAARLADAMDLPAAAIPAALRDELLELDRGERREDVAPLLDALTLAQSIDAGGSASFDRSAGPRRDALLLVAVGRAIADGDDSELSAMLADPCAERCRAPFDRWAAPSRVTVAALLEASSALRRLDRAWRAGDPFARASWAALGEHRRRLDFHVHAPAPRIADDGMLGAAPPGGPPARVDLVVAATARGVRLSHVPPVRVREGRIEEVDPEPPIDAPLPGPTPTGADPELVARLRAITLPPGAVIGVGASSEASASQLGRVLASMVEARRAPRVVVQRAADGTLRAAPVDVIERESAGAPGDLVVEVGRGGALAGATDASRAAIVQAALADRARGRRVVLDPGSAARASDVLDAAFTAARDGDLVAIVRP